jgi:acylphosphatase
VNERRDEQATSGSEDRVRLVATITGRVQGVGFRWWTRCRALELGLVGEAANLPDGRVRVRAEGPRERCEQLVGLLRGGGTPGAVTDVRESIEAAEGGFTGFVER